MDRRAECLEVDVDCGGRRHTIRWRDGVLSLLGHPGPRDRDDVLVALSGHVATCRLVEAAWYNLDDVRALHFLTVDALELAGMARGLALTVEQRAVLERRDDFTAGQRREAEDAFDQKIYQSRLASLGLDLARRRGLDARARLRWQPRRRGPRKPRLTIPR